MKFIKKFTCMSAVQNVLDYLESLPGDHKLLKKAYGTFAGGTSLSLMIVLSWTPSERISTSYRLGLCAGVWSWSALKSSLKCQCCLLIFACRVKATWKLSSVCLYSWGYITMQELCLTPLTPLLIWVPSSKMIGGPCIVM
jgi:hypothetical protein